MAIVSLQFVKSYFGISDTSLDDKINFMIPLVENDYRFIRNAPFDKDSDNNIIYPITAKETAALMIMWKLNNNSNIVIDDGKVGVSRETSSITWSLHSESYKDSNPLNKSGELKFGYPIDIVARIERFVGFKAV